MKKIYLITLLYSLLLGYSEVQANNLKIENVAFNASSRELSFDLSWENAWRVNAIYRDAVWIFAKLKSSNSQQWKPVVFDTNGPGSQVFGALQTTGQTAEGFYVTSSSISSSQFDIPATRVTIKLNLPDNALNPSFKVFGIEMVYIPEGEFYVGDGETSSLFRALGNADPVKIGQFPSRVSFNVDAIAGTIEHAQSYPRGYGAFYIMKYEATQQQIVDFLNCLSRSQQEGLLPNLLSENQERYIMAGSNTPMHRNGVAYDPTNTIVGQAVEFYLDLNDQNPPNSPDDGQFIACNYLSVNLYVAYLDWAHLRPITAYEYEKAARGFDTPVIGEAAWGNEVWTPVEVNSLQNAGTATEATTTTGIGLANTSTEEAGFIDGPLRVGFAATTSSNRSTSGGSYFGVMNLSDNLRELCHFATVANLAIVAESPLNFNSFGDGQLAPNGLSDQQEFYINAIYHQRGASFIEDTDANVFQRDRISNRISISGGPISAAIYDASGIPVISGGSLTPDTRDKRYGIRGARK